MFKYLVFVLVVCSVGIWAYFFGELDGRRTDGLTVVEAVCDYSHNVDSGAWEDACGLAQDSINAEYICDSKGITCQAEMKSL